MAHALRLFVAQYGLLALFVLLVIEEAGVLLPLPGDLFIVYFGYRASRSSTPWLAALPALLVVVAAACCGSLLLYTLTRRFRDRVRRLGRFIHLDERRLNWMERWLRSHGAWVIIPGRLIPGLRVPTTAVSGLFAIPVERFVPAVAVAALIWGALYLAIGAVGRTLLSRLVGLRHGELIPDLPEPLIVALAVLVVAVAVVAVYRRWPARLHC